MQHLFGYAITIALRHDLDLNYYLPGRMPELMYDDVGQQKAIEVQARFPSL